MEIWFYGKCSKCQAAVKAVEDTGQAFTLRGLHATYEDLFVPMFGSFAVHNAAAGVVAVEALTGQAIDEGALREGLADAKVPGRIEVVSRNPLMILDGAHNPAGAEALAEALREFFTWDRLHLVVGSPSGTHAANLGAPWLAQDHAGRVRGRRFRSPGCGRIPATAARRSRLGSDVAR